MAATDWPWGYGMLPPLPARTSIAETWFGGEYPEGRGRPQQTSGWQCPGCSRCFAPTVRECSHCGPKTELATSTNTGCCGPNGCEDAER